MKMGNHLLSSFPMCKCLVLTAHYGVAHTVLWEDDDGDRKLMVCAGARRNTGSLYRFELCECVIPYILCGVEY